MKRSSISLAIREIQIKTTVRNQHILERLQLQRLMILSSALEQLELSCLAGRVWSGIPIFRNYLASSNKVKYPPILRRRVSTPVYTPQRNECMHPLKNLSKYIHSNFICNRRKPETTQIAVNRRMDKQIVVILLSNKKNNLIYMCIYIH